MDSYDILVITLSVLLGVFLITAIVVLIKVRQLVQKVENVVDSAKHAATNVEDITAKLSSAASLSAFGTLATKLIKVFKKGGK